MLPAQYRLKERKEFNEIFRRGKTISSDVLLMKWKDSETEELKIGFSAGTKFSRKSSRRNKVKRWMRETIRSVTGEIRPGHQIIFLINSKFPYEQMSYALIEKEIKDLLGKAKLFRQ